VARSWGKGSHSGRVPPLEAFIVLTRRTGRDTIALLDTQGDEKQPAKGKVPLVRLQGGPHRPFPAQAREPHHRAGLQGPEELPRVLGPASRAHHQARQQDPVPAQGGGTQYVVLGRNPPPFFERLLGWVWGTLTTIEAELTD
jgi:hypothetical protein